ncbi:MAG: RagB/SusD family nutrient uptake outer membrane protein [Candidatus Azobacteroides sp.]|nr:RagB/SusD family nutrient uptake outer membrane protein [Candidatus Azobacteroides sp.]
MRNIINKAFIGVASLFFFAACDDFLDRSPESELTSDMQGIDPNDVDDAKIKNASQAESYLTSAYNAFGGEFYQLDIYQITETQSDNTYSGELNPDPLQLEEYKIDADNGIVSRDWEYMYTQIGTCNTIIKWVPQLTDLSEQRKNEIVGEASYIRAQCYFNLVRLFGACPLNVDDIPPITNENFDEIYPLLYKPRASVDSIYNQIISDLRIAENKVADYNASKFKITKPTVYSKLAEVYATRNAPEAVKWDSVRYYANLVTTDSRYGLLDNFEDVFSVTGDELTNPNSKESIFELNAVHNSSTGNWAYYMFVGTDWRKFCTPSMDLVKAFQREGDDVRLNASIKFDKATWADQIWDSNNYPFSYKIQGPDNVNIIMIRLAHIILLQAEAENELGNLAKAKELLNSVRNRAKLGDTPANDQVSLRLAIENERRLELAFEGYRWFDLKRTGRLYEVMRSCSDVQKNYASNLSSTDKWIWPIPQSELDLNENLTQNKGY